MTVVITNALLKTKAKLIKKISAITLISENLREDKLSV
jgi:hypothetical protein